MRRFRLLIIPVGKRAIGPWVERLMNQLAESFSVEVELARPLSYPLPAFNPCRRQFFAHLIIDYLRDIAREADFILGFTDVDIYSVHCNSVISECHLCSRSALISVGKLKDFLFGERPEDLFFERLYKETLRALGHMLGLPSCANPRCVMYPSLTLMETDLKSSSFCPECQTRLKVRFGFVPH